MPRIIILVVILLIALGCQFSLLPTETILIEPPDDFQAMDIATYRTSDGAFIAGSRNAPITIVIFSDYMCSHCQRYNATMLTVIEEFVRTEQARVERRLIANLGQLSTQYAKLAECVTVVSGDDSLFWSANNLLFEYGQDGGTSVDTVIARLADEFGLQQASLAECTLTADQYLTDMIVARLAGTSGTPAIRILLGTFDETDGQIPKPISDSHLSGGVDIDILREAIENANN